jgi:uncharacterized protein YndB with AHSA1/START domain
MVYYSKPGIMKNEPIAVEIEVNAPADKVWSAITDKEEMKKWYFDLKEFKPEVGFEFQFYGGTKEHQYLHLCRVTDVLPGKRITYSWRYDGYAGNSFVTFELHGKGKRTRVRLTHEGLESFPKENPDLAKENFVAGWNEIIKTSLKEYLKGE